MPHAGTSFVGRDRDLAELAQLFDAGARLVTVLGPTGVGKTRLAAAFAAERPSVVCDLTGASGAFDVVSIIGRALDVSLSSSSTIEEAIASLLARLGGNALLLVLDNFEQVIAEAAPAVSRLVAGRSSARVLVTSRERLRLPGESVLDLAPLAVADARALFLDRARAVRHGYDPAGEESAAIDAICGELDGLPLAIELAAARMRVLTAVELLARLNERFAVLTSSERTRSPRHATLRTALDWSWSSLGESERAALAQCSAFEGGFTLEAAEAILEAGGPILDLLHALRDKSLVWAKETQLGLRFGLYLSIRDHAAEKLAESEQAEAVFDRHAEHYLTRGLSWAAHAEATDGAAARAHLEAEQANLLAIHRRAFEAKDAERAIRAAIVLQPVLLARGPAALRLELLDRSLALAAEDGTVHPRLIGWATLARGDTLLGMGRMAEARVMIERAIEEGAVEDDRLHGRALWMLGVMHASQDRAEEARAELERALAIHRRVGDRVHEGRTLASLGALALDGGDLDRASELFEDAFSLLEESKDERWIGRTIGLLGGVEDARGNVEEARQLYLQAISVHDRSGERRHLAQVLGALAALDVELGNLDRAEETFARALAIRHEVPDRRTEGMIRILAGVLREERGDLTGALESHREAVRIQREIGSRRSLAIALAHHARAEGLAGKRDRARARLEEAKTALDRTDPLVDALVGIVEGHLVMAEDPRSAEALLASAAPIAERSALVRRAARALRAALSDGLPDEALVVGTGWFKPPGRRRIDISSRRAPSALLAALANARRQTPGSSLTVDELFNAGWPGERALSAAAASRVYVAISTLRKLGLGELLIRDDAGYRLDPSVPLLEG